MKNMKWMTLFVLLIVGSLVTAACGPTTPEAIEKEVTRIVEKEVTRVVKETVVAEATPQVVEKEVTRVVTATPEPEPETAEESGTEGEAANEPVVPDEPDRGDILEELDQAIANIKENPTSDEARLELADLLFKAGYFQDARANLQPLADGSQAPIEALMLMGDLEYLLGNYDAAEEYLQRAVESAADDVQTQIMAQIKLLFVYYQTNQYAKSQDLLKGFEDSIVLPTWDLMKAFDEPPYQIDWNGAAETVIPFVFTDPLPLLPVEINGEPIWVLIDTGGDAFVLDEEIAASLGIEPVTTFMGTGGGGLQMEVGMGRADTLKIGDVTINSVPVMTTATQRWSDIYEGDYTLGGIITTGVLKQFLSTVDYLNGQLILRPRTEAGKQALEQELEGQTVSEVPFTLALTHMMMAQGKLNDQVNLTFFVDSGLEDDKGAGFAAPIQTLNYVGIPVPETSVDPDDVGGLGGKFATGYFPIEELGLGSLAQKDLLGVYGGLTPDMYWNPAGFIQDGLISHNFLRQYDSWTLDFDEMTYYFVGEGGAESEAAGELAVPDEPDRGDLLAAIEEAEAALEGDPDSAELRYELANLHYQAGHFAAAKETLQPLLDTGEASDDAKLLMGELEYLTGNYAAAEEILLDLKETSSDMMAQIMAQVKLVFVYYQTNEYAKSQDLLQGMEGQIQLPTLDLMKGYGEERPYQIDWNGQTETSLPFVIADPLPIVEVEVDGEPIYALLDTGGDAFIVDSELAASLGIEPLATFIGTYAGGLQAETSYAKADSLKLGDVTITSVPVMVLPTERFSAGFAEGQYPIRGILGTATLRQLLSTIDYENEQIILRPRTEDAQQELMSSFVGKRVTGIPFALAATHLMMAKGQVNDKDDLTFFVDSGLADEDGAAFVAPIQTLNYVGIPVPETEVREGVGGGGGAGYATGNFDIEELWMGTLAQTDSLGVYGTSEPESYWALGFIQDGLISHNFLRQYDSWTLDFSDMVYYFAE